MKVKVLTFGTFDGLHPGHISYLQQARRQGSHITVIVARDTSVKKAKRHRPHFTERQRLAVVRALRIVDIAILGDSNDHFRLIQKIHPDVICLGYDHRISVRDLHRLLAQRGMRKILIRRMKPYHPLTSKSSLLFLTHGQEKN